MTLRTPTAVVNRTRNYPRKIWTRVDRLGVDVHARVWLNGHASDTKPPVVLVHGLALSSRYMVPLGRRLADHYDVLAPDLPGFGRTRKPVGARWPAGPNVREQADQLLMWMDACGIRRAVLFGDSLGVQVVIDVAARFPERVARLILKGPTPDPRFRSVAKQYSRVLTNMMFEAPAMNALYQIDYASAGLPRMFQQLGRTVDDRIETKLPKVTAPVLVLRGQHDKSLTHEWAEEFTRLLPDGRLVVIDGASHNVHFMAPQLTAQVMTDFIEGRLDGVGHAGRPGGDILYRRMDAHDDPFAPPKPMSTLAHGVLDYLVAAVCFIAPRVLPCGPRTRQVLTMAGVSATTYSLLTDYECGVLKKLPMPLHLNFDASSGFQQLAVAGTILRGEPLAGRCVVAALGAYNLMGAAMTRMPMGPVHLVPVDRPENAAPALESAAAQAAGA